MHSETLTYSDFSQNPLGLCLSVLAEVEEVLNQILEPLISGEARIAVG